MCLYSNVKIAAALTLYIMNHFPFPCIDDFHFIWTFSIFITTYYLCLDPIWNCLGFLYIYVDFYHQNCHGFQCLILSVCLFVCLSVCMYIQIFIYMYTHTHVCLKLGCVITLGPGQAKASGPLSKPQFFPAALLVATLGLR